VKLRVYLLIASTVSTGIILISLFICYRFMLLTVKEVLLLSSVTLSAALVSMIVHFFMTRPLERSIQSIAMETSRIAEGNFQGEVPRIGPIEFQRLADQFNAMTAKLQESFHQLKTAEASRRELVANVSHDLRTPMASIQSFVEALQDDIIQDSETFQRYLRTIQHETSRLNGLIEELFSLSQLEAGTVAYEPEKIHVDHLLLEGLQSLDFQLKDKRLHIDVDLPDRLPPVAVVPAQVKRVLANIMQNAIRHSPIDSLIRIAVNEQDERFVRIAISDQGSGIPLGEQKPIFERFYRADPSRNRESGGAGLGLAIAKSIVELHGGTIGVESTPGEGSSFWFTIPVYQEKL
jgi:signal transduction histidine kinase